MEDDLGAGAFEDPREGTGVADVLLEQLGAARERAVEVLAPSRREIVDDGHLVAAGEQGVDKVRSDEAGSAGDEGAHGGGIIGARCGRSGATGGGLGRW